MGESQSICANLCVCKYVCLTIPKGFKKSKKVTGKQVIFSLGFTQRVLIYRETTDHAKILGLHKSVFK